MREGDDTEVHGAANVGRALIDLGYDLQVVVLLLNRPGDYA